jgi:hypothetical protein
VLLWLEENRVKLSINSSSRGQSKNARVFNKGDADGVEKRGSEVVRRSGFTLFCKCFEGGDASKREQWWTKKRLGMHKAKRSNVAEGG